MSLGKEDNNDARDAVITQGQAKERRIGVPRVSAVGRSGGDGVEWMGRAEVVVCGTRMRRMARWYVRYGM